MLGSLLLVAALIGRLPFLGAGILYQVQSSDPEELNHTTEGQSNEDNLAHPAQVHVAVPGGVQPTRQEPTAAQRAAAAAAVAAATAVAESMAAMAATKPRELHLSEASTAVQETALDVMTATHGLTNDLEKEQARWYDIQTKKLTLLRDLTRINQSKEEVDQALGNLDPFKMLGSVPVQPIMDAIQNALKQGEAVVMAYKFTDGPGIEAVSYWFTDLTNKATAILKQLNDSTAENAIKCARDIAASTSHLVQTTESIFSAYQKSKDLLDEVQAERGVAAEVLLLQHRKNKDAGVAARPNTGSEETTRSLLLKRAGSVSTTSFTEMDLEHAIAWKGSQSNCDKVTGAIVLANTTVVDFAEKIRFIRNSLPAMLSPLGQAATNAGANVDSQLMPLLDNPFLSSPLSSALSSNLHSSFATLVNFPAQLDSAIGAAVSLADDAIDHALQLLPPVYDDIEQLLSTLKSTCSLNATDVTTQ